MEKSRIKFAKKSLKKACSYQDPFVKFIVLWIGLNALYHTDETDYESEKIKLYFQKKEGLVFELLRKNKRSLESTAQFINKTPQHVKLKNFLGTRRAFLKLNNKKNSVDDFANFLQKIRNNMFHAAKLWDEEAEANLLSMVNPILEELLDRLIGNCC